MKLAVLDTTIPGSSWLEKASHLKAARARGVDVSAEAVAHGVDSILSALTGVAVVPSAVRMTLTVGDSSGSGDFNFREVVSKSLKLGTGRVVVVPRSAPHLDKNLVQRQLESIIDDGLSLVEGHDLKILVANVGSQQGVFPNRLDAAVNFAQSWATSSVGVAADVAVMYREEDKVPYRLRRAQGAIGHVYLGDTDGRLPYPEGTNFGPVLKALQQMGFLDFITLSGVPVDKPEFFQAAEFARRLLVRSWED